jgi:hypothetical protein
MGATTSTKKLDEKNITNENQMDLKNNVTNQLLNINKIISEQVNNSIQNITVKNLTNDEIKTLINQKSNMGDINISGSSNSTIDASQKATVQVSLESISQVMTKIDFKDELIKDLQTNFLQNSKNSNDIQNSLKEILKNQNEFEKDGKSTFSLDVTDMVQTAGKAVNTLAGSFGGSTSDENISKLNVNMINKNNIQNVVNNLTKNENVQSNIIKNIVEKNMNNENSKKCIANLIIMQDKTVGNLNLSNSNNVNVKLGQEASISSALKCFNLTDMSMEFINTLLDKSKIDSSQITENKTSNKTDLIIESNSTTKEKITDAMSRFISSIPSYVWIIVIVIGVIFFGIYVSKVFFSNYSNSNNNN